LAINAKYVHSSLAVWILAGGVSKYARAPHDVKVVEATIHQENCDIAGQVAVFAPDVVGISTYIWNADKLLELLNLLKEKLPKAIIVLGGPEASYNSEYWLACGADYVLCGEGEYSFPLLLDTLGDAKPKQSEPEHPIEAVVPSEPSEPIAPIDPYSDAYFDALGGRIAYIETSRGCPYQCSFCLSGGSIVSFFPLDTVKKQLYKLSCAGAKTIKLVDRTFNCNANRACELFEYIIGLDTTCCFHFEVAADLFDERQLSILSRAPAGRIQLEAGLQSFYEPALKASSRHTDIKKAEKNIRLLLKNKNIHIHVDLIAGLPYETLSDFQVGFNRAFALGAHTLQLGFLKLLHGSTIRSQAEELKIQYNSRPPYEISRSPWLSAEDLRILSQTENALQHTYNKSRFLSTLEYVKSVSELSPFSLFRALGEAAPNHGTDLADYAQQIYDCFAKLPSVRDDKLQDCMVCDWLSMVKGKNLPRFLLNLDRRHAQLIKAAESLFGHTVARNEAAILRSGVGVVVDSNDRDPVTGLYRLSFIPLQH